MTEPVPPGKTSSQRQDPSPEAVVHEFNTLLDIIDYGVLVLGPDLHLRICNHAYRELWDIPQNLIDRKPSARELIQYNKERGFYDVAADDWDRYLEDRIASIMAGNVGPLEFARSDGRHLRYQCRVLPDGGRMLTYFDISDIRKQADAYAEQSDILHATLEHTSQGIAMLDSDDRMITFNRRFHETLGLTAEACQNACLFTEILAESPVISDAVAFRRKMDELRAAGPVDSEGFAFEYAGASGRVLEVQGKSVPGRGQLITFSDVSAHKKAEHSLRNNEMLKRSVLDSSLECIISMDEDGRIIEFNPAAERTFGFARANVLGWKMDELIIPARYREQHRDGFARFLATGETNVLNRRVELTAIRADGQEIPIEIAVTGSRIDGKFITTGFLRDISDRKKAEASLRDSEALKRAILESSLECIVSIDEGGKIIEFNPAAERTFGWPRDAVIGQPMTDILVPPAMRAAHAKGFARYLQSGIAHVLDRRIELTALRRDGVEIPVEIAITAKRISGRQVFTAYLRDITESKRVQEALRSSEERYALAVDGTNEGLWDWDAASDQLYVSPRFKSLVRLEVEESRIPPSVWLARMHPDDLAHYKDRLRAHLKGQTDSLKAEFRVSDGTGGFRWLFLNGAGLRDAQGRIYRMAGSLGDFTDRKTEQLELARAKEAAEAATLAKSQFLANMSHELRTPMNAIIGFTRLVMRRSSNLEPKHYANLEKILKSSDHLLQLINSVLDLSKIEAGQMDFVRESVSLPSLIEEAFKVMEPLTQEKGLHLRQEIAENLGPLATDSAKLKQIVLNLLSNAVKFTEAGEILVRATTQGDRLRIAVIDTGIGIPAEATKRIFEEFSQVDNSLTRKYGGTGLGLSITRRLVELLGGEITVESNLGKGSCFTVSLPSNVSAESPCAPSPAPSEAPPGVAKILMIDDDPNALYLLSENLREAGYHCLQAGDGAEGLALARECKPDAITLDIVMPDMDGWQTLRELKSDPATKDIPVILATVVDQRQLGYRLGAAGYLLKPFDRDSVMNTLSEIMRDSSESLP
jgi:PAS domain S-box-containing protein